MAQISEEQKANMQMVFNGLAKYFKALNLPDDYQKRVNEYMQKLWQIIKDYGTPESRKADTPESEDYWTNFVRSMNVLHDEYATIYEEHGKSFDQKDIVRFIHWFMFDLIQITERWKS